MLQQLKNVVLRVIVLGILGVPMSITLWNAAKRLQEQALREAQTPATAEELVMGRLKAHGHPASAGENL